MSSNKPPQSVSVKPSADHAVPTSSSILANLAYTAQASGREVPACVCRQCGGARYVLKDVPYGHPDFNRLVPCPLCRQDRQPDWLFDRSGLEPHERGLSLRDWRRIHWPADVDGEQLNAQREAAQDELERLLEVRAGWLTLYGDLGAGKSHALKILACEFIQRGVQAIYNPMASVLQYLRENIKARTAQGDQFWKRLEDTPVLLIDEVDRFNATSWAQEQVFMLVDLRYRRQTTHVTVFATNGDPNRRVGPDGEKHAVGYIYSRMTECPMVHLQNDVRPAVRGARHGK